MVTDKESANRRIPDPSFLVIWSHDGENHWDIVRKSKYLGLLEILLNRGVDPADIQFVHTVHLNPSFPSAGKKLMAETDQKIEHTHPVTPEPNYGYIAPDGRFLRCAYGQHSELARKIVGCMEDIKDAQRYLEDCGWAVILKDPFSKKKYSLGMGAGKKLTDRQIETIERLEIGKDLNNFSKYL